MLIGHAILHRFDSIRMLARDALWSTARGIIVAARSPDPHSETRG